jgi:hypothetical protein
VTTAYVINYRKLLQLTHVFTLNPIVYPQTMGAKLQLW